MILIAPDEQKKQQSIRKDASAQEHGQELNDYIPEVGRTYYRKVTHFWENKNKVQQGGKHYPYQNPCQDRIQLL